MQGSEPLKNPRHERFCQEYLKDLNATQAYKRSYPDNNSYNGQCVEASRLLSNDKVIERIAFIKAELTRKCDYSVEDWRRDVLEARTSCKDEKNRSVQQRYDNMIGQHIGAFEEHLRQAAGSLLDLFAQMGDNKEVTEDNDAV